MMDSENKLSVGEKLLKEPIWIGMIVILNLILFFCITYVIRRKCGQKISDMMPKRKRSESTVVKDSKADPPSMERSSYSLSLETTPRLSVLSRPRLKPRLSIEIHQQDKPEPSISSSLSLPQTPVINEHNSEAALKLFAAYNAEKEAKPSFTELTADNSKRLVAQNSGDFMAYGFQGGRVSFSDDEELVKDKQDDKNLGTGNHVLARSKSSEVRADTHVDRTMKRVFTYPKPTGSPKLNTKQETSVNIQHCYPEIRIVNEFDEECKNTDSDNSIMGSPRIKLGVSPSKSLCNEEINIGSNLENMDSGYPSTSTVSSNNTQSTTQESVTSKHSAPSAAERRRMFGAKSKSSTFYRLSAQTLEADNDEIELPMVSINETNIERKQRFLPDRHAFKSFESGMVCRSCNDLSNFSMNSFSIESDLDRMRRCESFCQCCSHLEYEPPRHSCGRRKHQRRHKYCCHRHGYTDRDLSRSRHVHNVHSRSHGVHHVHQPRYFTRYTSPTSRYLSLSEIRDIRRNHKRALARLSSTESEGFNQELESYHKRKVYSSKEHYSDGCMSYGGHRRLLSSSPNFISCRDEHLRNDHFKNQMMQSFLSDAYNSNVHLDDRGVEMFAEQPSSNNHLALPQNSISDQLGSPMTYHSQESSKSISPIRRLSSKTLSQNSVKSNPSPVHISSTSIESKPRNVMYEDIKSNVRNSDSFENVKPDNVSYGEVVKPKVRNSDSNSFGARTINIAYGEVVKPKIRNVDSNSGIVKDSAYQTKQSSIEIHNTVQREGSILSNNMAKEDDDDDISYDKRSDPVRRHLQKAALKLVLLKRKQNYEDSKDSAIQTFSGDEMSLEEDNRRSFEKRKGAILAMQMKEIKLSQVKEEHSVLSKDTDSLNTPNNETMSETADKSVASVDKTVNSANDVMNDDFFAVQETVV